MKYLLSVLIVGFLSFTTIAQKTYLVVTTQGDTLMGKVNLFVSQKNVHMVSVKSKEGKQTFKVYQVKSIVYNDDTYHTVKIDNTYQFAKLIKSGYLSLYEYVDYQSGSTTFNSSILIKNTGESMPVPNLTFKKGLSDFLKDCELVIQKITAKAYKKSDLHLIIDDYNQCITNKTNATMAFAEKTSELVTRSGHIDQIIDKLNSLNSFKNKDELVEMLNDVKTKILNGEKIPSYLSKTLKSEFASNNDLLELLSKASE